MKIGSGADSKRPVASSPWGSDESREFTQERLARFSGVLFLVSLPFFVAGWLVDLVWYPRGLAHGLPLTAAHFFNLAYMILLLAIWLVARGAPLSSPVLHVLDGLGMFLVSAAFLGMCFSIPGVLRPDLAAVIGLIVLLLYRAAIVPSEPSRTAWIGTLCTAPLPVLTYLAYRHRAAAPGATSAWAAYTAYAFLFSILVVLLSSKVSSVIYRLRQTVREARRLGPYTLEAKIGEGGMGAVYRARHALLRRPTAIKILAPERASEMDLARFEREVQMTSLLTSPHTVSVYDFGRTPDGLFYYAMEYLDGIDLQELVSQDGPLHPGRVVRVLRQVCEALGEAHRVGLIHRDIKPANILLCQRGGRSDVAKVVDFGLVRDLAAVSSRLTHDRLVLGTPHYLSPESLRGSDRIDARSDLYALGATAYYLLTGVPVFEGGLAEIFAHHLGTPPAPPSGRLGRPLPGSLEALVLACLAKDPNDRPESTDALDAVLAGCDDVPLWTEADAEAWWRTRGVRIRSARDGTADAGTTAQSTLDIDRDRLAALEESAARLG